MTEAAMKNNHTILVVDDEELVRNTIRSLLEKESYNVLTAADGYESLDVVGAGDIDVIISDIDMPGMNGFQLSKNIKGNRNTRHIPVVLITGYAGEDTRLKAIEAGVDEFLSKPVNSRELSARIRILCEVKDYHDMRELYKDVLEEEVNRRTEKLNHAYELVKEFSLETIHRLSRAAEFRDNDTGAHIQRISCYSEILAEKLGWMKAALDELHYAAPLHDVGKIAIPDSILLKPAKLSPDEWKIMKRHTVFGARILTGSKSKFLQLAETIAISHHERWDGSGYPRGLQGEEIPEAGRIVAVADVFDALSSKRPYKRAFSETEAFGVMEEGKGSHFDPRILRAFFSSKEKILEKKHEFGEEEGGNPASPNTEPVSGL